MDASTHPILKELDRLKAYQGKIRSAQEPKSRSAGVDRVVADRLVRHALSQPAGGSQTRGFPLHTRFDVGGVQEEVEHGARALEAAPRRTAEAVQKVQATPAEISVPRKSRAKQASVNVKVSQPGEASQTRRFPSHTRLDVNGVQEEVEHGARALEAAPRRTAEAVQKVQAARPSTASPVEISVPRNSRAKQVNVKGIGKRPLDEMVDHGRTSQPKKPKEKRVKFHNYVGTQQKDKGKASIAKRKGETAGKKQTTEELQKTPKEMKAIRAAEQKDAAQPQKSKRQASTDASTSAKSKKKQSQNRSLQVQKADAVSRTKSSTRKHERANKLSGKGKQNGKQEGKQKGKQKGNQKGNQRQPKRQKERQSKWEAVGVYI